MTSRILHGDIGDGTFVFRVSKPGFDVEAEPFGSRGISFDSRLSDIGTVVASGWFSGGAAVSVPGHAVRADRAHLSVGWVSDECLQRQGIR